jgi:CubicO group peptidase (beta-lactamase class C family)
MRNDRPLHRREFLTACGSAAVGLSLPSAAPARQAATGDAASKQLVADLEQETSDLMRAAEVPGVSIALIKDGDVFWRRGFGIRDVRSKQAVDVETVFEAASTSKPVFAYAVMKLREKGVLDLDTPLTRYTPDRPLEGEPRLDRITARHVLSHTSGLPNWRSKQKPLAIAFTPGEQWQYSGEGFSYLQSVVSRLTGSRVNQSDCGTFEAGLKVCAMEPSIDQYMQTSVLRPFGMTSSGYLWSQSMEAQVAWGHDPKGQPLKSSRKPNGAAVARYGMAGGLCTTPTDYARFLVEIVNPRPADTFRLTPASLAEMLRPAVKATPQTAWSLGWEISQTAGGDVIRHAGGNPGYSCFVAASVARKAGYVIMTNSEDAGFFGVIVKLIAGTALPRLIGGALQP